MCFVNSDSLRASKARGERTVYKHLILTATGEGDVVLSSPIYFHHWWSLNNGAIKARKVKISPKTSFAMYKSGESVERTKVIEIGKGYHAYLFNKNFDVLEDLKRDIKEIMTGMIHSTVVHGVSFTIPANTRYFISLKSGECVAEQLQFGGDLLVLTTIGEKPSVVKVNLPNLIEHIYNQLDKQVKSSNDIVKAILKEDA